MAGQNNVKGNRSRYETNRTCYRKNEDEYVYLQWKGTHEDGSACYERLTLRAGENGVTKEHLDCLQAADDLEVRQQENDKRLLARLAPFGELYARSAEDELFSDDYSDDEEDAQTRAFNEHVRPHLTERQEELIHERYGMGKTLQQIADESPLKDDGTPVSHQSVSNRLMRVWNTTKKYMPQ